MIKAVHSPPFVSSLVRKSPHDVHFQSYYKSPKVFKYFNVNSGWAGSPLAFANLSPTHTLDGQINIPSKEKAASTRDKTTFTSAGLWLCLQQTGSAHTVLYPFAGGQQFLQELVWLPVQGSDCSSSSSRWREGTTHSTKDSNPGTLHLATPTAHVKSGGFGFGFFFPCPQPGESFLSHDGQLWKCQCGAGVELALTFKGSWTSNSPGRFGTSNLSNP